MYVDSKGGPCESNLVWSHIPTFPLNPATGIINDANDDCPGHAFVKKARVVSSKRQRSGFVKRTHLPNLNAGLRTRSSPGLVHRQSLAWVDGLNRPRAFWMLSKLQPLITGVVSLDPRGRLSGLAVAAAVHPPPLKRVKTWQIILIHVAPFISTEYTCRSHVIFDSFDRGLFLRERQLALVARQSWPHRWNVHI